MHYLVWKLLSAIYKFLSFIHSSRLTVSKASVRSMRAACSVLCFSPVSASARRSCLRSLCWTWTHTGFLACFPVLSLRWAYSARHKPGARILPATEGRVMHQCSFLFFPDQKRVYCHIAQVILTAELSAWLLCDARSTVRINNTVECWITLNCISNGPISCIFIRLGH